MIELRIFGFPDLRNPAGSIHLQPKRLALLAYLTLASSSGYCRRDKLLSLFWPEADEDRARNALSQVAYQLRRVLGSDALIGRGMEELRISSDLLWCDAVAFDRALDETRPEDALALYRGPLLDGLHVGDAPDFEHWLEVERERFRHRATRAAADLAEHEETSGNRAGAAGWLRRMLALAPTDEAVLRRLMNLLTDLGDRTGALRTYETFVRNLKQELDLPPSIEVQMLADRLRRSTEVGTTPVKDTSPTLAVLPFDNLSPDPDQVYFCIGITEEIINALARIRGLRVTARTSTFALKDEPVEIRTLARKLGVDAVVEGSVRRMGRQVRITAQLINASDGFHIWSERYDRPLDDVFAVQDEIAQAVADALELELLQAPAQQSSSSDTQDVQAHALYLRGLFHRRRRTPEDLGKAIACFEEAVAYDPTYAQAHAALAFTYALSGWFLYDVLPPRRAYPSARASAEKALSLSPRLPEAHLATAYTCNAFEWNWAKAEKAFKQALAIDPDNPDTLGNYSGFLVSHGHFDEALALTRQLEVLDPFWIMPRVGEGIWLLAARRFDAAIDRLRQAHAMEPRLFVAPLFLGDACRLTGRLDEAGDAYRCVLDLIGRRPLILGRLGALYAAQNRPEAAHEMVEEIHNLSKTRYVPPCSVAEIYLALEDYDRAFHYLEEAYRERDTTLTLIKTWPAYDAVRSDSRFQQLMRNLDLF